MRIVRLATGIFYYLLIILASGELFVRFFFGHFDLDGNFCFRDQWLSPYHLPIQRAKKIIPQWVRNYDPFLGWIPSPGKMEWEASSREEALYTNNMDSIRVSSRGDSFSFVPRPGVLRIALFGDSFTYGYEVAFKDTWGDQLENNLKRQGIDAEVLNFGVPGYGVDQAFLRWKKQGYKYAPQIVILGFYEDDIYRNGNLFPLIGGALRRVPLFKPRFIFENDQLKLVNSPTPKPEDIINILEHYESWEMSKYDFWFDSEKYKDNIWLKSKFLSLGLFLMDKLKGKDFAGEETLQLLGLRILNSFKADVESRGLHFYVVSLRDSYDLSSVLHGRQSEYYHYLLSSDAPLMIFPEQKLLEEACRTSMRSLFYDTHYSAKANKIVADVVSDYIIQQLKERTFYDY